MTVGKGIEGIGDNSRDSHTGVCGYEFWDLSFVAIPTAASRYSPTIVLKVQGEPATWWARQDSNLRPSGYEPPALPLSYEPVERETRLELATTCLEGRDSTN